MPQGGGGGEGDDAAVESTSEQRRRRRMLSSSDAQTLARDGAHILTHEVRLGIDPRHLVNLTICKSKLGINLPNGVVRYPALARGARVARGGCRRHRHVRTRCVVQHAARRRPLRADVAVAAQRPGHLPRRARRHQRDGSPCCTAIHGEGGERGAVRAGERQRLSARRSACTQVWCRKQFFSKNKKKKMKLWFCFLCRGKQTTTLRHGKGGCGHVERDVAEGRRRQRRGGGPISGALRGRAVQVDISWEIYKSFELLSEFLSSSSSFFIFFFFFFILLPFPP